MARLRDILRSRRVSAVSQVGTDRVVRFTFSDGQYQLFLEFFAGGNIVVTDAQLNILALLRTVSEGAEHERVRVGGPYALAHMQNYAGVPPLSKERLLAALNGALDKAAAAAAATEEKKNKDSSEVTGFGQKFSKRKAGGGGAGDLLKRALAAAFTEYPPPLLEHVLRMAQFDVATPLAEITQSDELLSRLLAVLEQAENIVQASVKSPAAPGFIIAKPRKGSSAANADASSKAVQPEAEKATQPPPPSPPKLLYEDFHPFRPQKYVDDPNVTVLSFEGFNRTVDEFFSSIEGQKLESRVLEHEETAKRKLEAARKNHQSRLDGLQDVQRLNVRKAQVIEANINDVEEAIEVVNGLIGQGMDWVEIARLIELEQGRRNPLAQMIRLPLKLYENTITLLLNEQGTDDDDNDDEEDEYSDEWDNERDNEPEKARKRKEGAQLAVDIDLGLSPWANARQYYDQKRSAAVKEQKTLQQSSKALKNAERKVVADLKKGLKQEKELLRPVRQQLWFEKFIFFVSSDGYLVLA